MRGTAARDEELLGGRGVFGRLLGRTGHNRGARGRTALEPPSNPVMPKPPPPASLQSTARSITATATRCQPAVPAATCLSPVRGPAPAPLAAALSAHPGSCPACSAAPYQQWRGQLAGCEGRRERAVVPAGPTPLQCGGMRGAPGPGAGAPACRGLAAWPWASPLPPAPELASELCRLQ